MIYFCFYFFTASCTSPRPPKRKKRVASGEWTRTTDFRVFSEASRVGNVDMSPTR